MGNIAARKCVDKDGHDLGIVHYWFMCPGCKQPHPYTVGPKGVAGYGEARWTFNGDMEKPSFTPSLIVNPGRSNVCHLFVTDGVINFCSDCHHELAGKQGVPIPELPEWLR